MRIVVTGATGMLGRAFIQVALEHGDEIVAFSRDAERAARTLPGGVETSEWSPSEGPAPAEALAGADGVVHLLGENVGQRWTDEARRKIRESRIAGTRNLVAGIEAAEPRPRVLVSQSASGFYGPRCDEVVTEDTGPGEGFLAEVVIDWEAEAAKARDLGLRVVMTRTGVVLSDSGGALEKMIPPFKLGVGGPVAGGDQYVPWIHAEDVAGALHFCLHQERASGPVNVSAPEPVTNRELSKALGRVLNRPSLAPVPAFAVKLLYGEMAQIVTTGVRMTPAQLTELGYEFRHTDLEEALRDATR